MAVLMNEQPLTINRQSIRMRPDKNINALRFDLNPFHSGALTE